MRRPISGRRSARIRTASRPTSSWPGISTARTAARRPGPSSRRRSGSTRGSRRSSSSWASSTPRSAGSRTPCAWSRSSRRSHPKSSGPLTLKGQILLAQGNVKAAADAFNGAIALGGSTSAAHRGLAQALEAQGLPDRAIEQYRKSLALKGDDVITLNNLAWLLLESKKQPDEALALATKAYQLAPRSAEVADTLGWVHYRRGAYIDAEKTLAQAEQQAPGNAQIKYHLGMTYVKLGKKNDAVSSLRRAAQLDPKLAQAEKIADMIKELGG